jgi:hypothetical protein
MGPLTLAERKEAMRYSAMADKYDETINRKSAYEVLKDRAEKLAKAQEKAKTKEEAQGRAPSRKAPARRRSNRQSVGEAALKSTARTLANEIVRGLFGSFKKR